MAVPGTIRFAIVGCGGITLQNHLPGLALCRDARLTALCDVDAATLDRARQQTGVATVSTDYREIVRREDVDAVIIATPNFTHAAIALEADRSWQTCAVRETAGPEFWRSSSDG